MDAGVVELESGTWDWRLSRAETGSLVVFRSWERLDEQMRSWIPEHGLSAEAARKLALDPVMRTWKDNQDCSWEVSVRETSCSPASRDRSPGGAGDRVALVFARGSYRLATLIDRSVPLGALTKRELGTLFASAGPWS